MKNVGVVYDQIFSQHDTGNGHPERAERVIATVKRLTSLDMYGEGRRTHFEPIEPRKATPEQILWCHKKKLLDLIEKKSEQAKRSNSLHFLDGYGETSVSAATYEATLKSAGGNFAAIDAIFEKKIDRAFVLCRPPGHHTNTSQARGFCGFNSVALASQYLFHEKNLKKVAIVDCDVHAGNGTEEIFNSGVMDGEVLFFSLHQHPRTLYPATCYPEEIGEGAQEGKNVNLTFYPNSGQQSVKHAFNQIISPMLEEFKPEFILISAGFDAHHLDSIANLLYMKQTYSYIFRELCDFADKHANGRVQATLEGGYHLQVLADSISNSIASMAGEKPPFEEADLQEDDPRAWEYCESHLIPLLKNTLAPYWKCF
jgi:acetoin utilization deacetylase AcuC-like enzyme